MRIAYAILSVKRMFLLIYISICNVMSLKRKQVAAKQTFVFWTHQLTNILRSRIFVSLYYNEYKKANLLA